MSPTTGIKERQPHRKLSFFFICFMNSDSALISAIEYLVKGMFSVLRGSKLHFYHN
mgnify:CR=1 FL=1